MAPHADLADCRRDDVASDRGATVHLCRPHRHRFVDIVTDLVITDRAGVEIDYCPRCRGVWLDRGELDKIIDRASAELAQPAPAPTPPPQPMTPPMAPAQMPPHVRWHLSDPRHYGQGYPKRRKSFLKEMFDF